MGRLYCLVLAGILVLVQGCSSDTHENSAARIAAVVNGSEITRREVDFIYRSSGGTDDGDSLALPVKRKILAELVRAELLAQSATESGLDNSPDFMVAQYQANRKVLASLAEREILSAVPMVSLAEVQSIIKANPVLFEQRKLLVYEEVLIPEVDVDFLGKIDNKAKAGANLEQLLAEFSAINQAYRRSLRVLTSDQIPVGIYTVLAASSPGRPVVARVEDKFAMILVLNSIAPAPLEGAAAERSVGEKVFSSRRDAAVRNSVAELIDAASITYYGAYAQDSIGTQKLAPLPSPNQELRAHKRYKSSVLGFVQAVSVLFGVLQLTLSVSLLKGKLWMPRLWPQKRDSMTDAYAMPMLPPRLERFTMYLAALVSLGALGAEVVMLRDDLPYWGLIVSVVIGGLVGGAASRVFGLTLLSNVFSKLQKPGIGFFMVCILVCTLFVFRFAFV